MIPPTPENGPRDAGGWLDEHLQDGYKKTADQARLTGFLDRSKVLLPERGMRSFRRMEKAIQQIAAAIRSGIHVVTPPDPPAPETNPPSSS